MFVDVVKLKFTERGHKGVRLGYEKVRHVIRLVGNETSIA